MNDHKTFIHLPLRSTLYNAMGCTMSGHLSRFQGHRIETTGPSCIMRSTPRKQLRNMCPNFAGCPLDAYRQNMQIYEISTLPININIANIAGHVNKIPVQDLKDQNISNALSQTAPLQHGCWFRSGFCVHPARTHKPS